jgi:hypothetical protein
MDFTKLEKHDKSDKLLSPKFKSVTNDFRKFSTLSDKKTEYTTLSNLMYKKDNSLKLVIVLATILVIASIIVSLILPFFEKSPRILTFNYIKTDSEKNKKDLENIFSLNIDMLYIFLSILVVINIYLAFLLVSEMDSMLVKLIYSDFQWHFLLAQIFLSSAFILGVTINLGDTVYPFIISTIVWLFIILLICFFYGWIKEKKNLSVSSFINLSMYSSIIFSFAIYLEFYNLSQIVYFIFKNTSSKGEANLEIVQQVCTITSHSIILLINLVLAAYFKDIIFSACYCYFLFGYLTSQNEIFNKELVSIVIILIFNLAAIFVTLLRYGKGAFGFEDDRQVQEILAARNEHKKSSWFSAQA